MVTIASMVQVSLLREEVGKLTQVEPGGAKVVSMSLNIHCNSLSMKCSTKFSAKSSELNIWL